MTVYDDMRAIGVSEEHFEELTAAFRRMARRLVRRSDPALEDDLVGSAWLRLVQIGDRGYSLQQLVVVGLNAMRRQMFYEIRERSVPRVSPENEPGYESRSDRAAEIREALGRVAAGLSDSAREVLLSFCRRPDSFTAAAARVGMSAATACRVADAVRSRLGELGVTD